MKFGKQILRESGLDQRLHYTNFKQLKKILKALVSALETGDWDLANIFHLEFFTFLQNEMLNVESTYSSELHKIDVVQKKIMQLFPLLAIQADPEVFCSLKFEQLLDHLQTECFSDELFTVCSNLGEMSSRCKRLRRNVIWNSIAVVKIIKKMKKMTKMYILPTESASSILSSQNWYSSLKLPELISAVDTMIEEVMTRLTSKPPSRECYTCPICLDLIVDPVTLRGCLHRFCWNCLARATVSAQETGQEMERCPYCRSSCTLDPETFAVDGILNRFLRRFFPEDIESRMANEEAERISLVTAYNNRKMENGIQKQMPIVENISCKKESSNLLPSVPLEEPMWEKDPLLAYCYQSIQEGESTDIPSSIVENVSSSSSNSFCMKPVSSPSKFKKVLAPLDTPPVEKDYSLWSPSQEIMERDFWQAATHSSTPLLAVVSSLSLGPPPGFPHSLHAPPSGKWKEAMTSFVSPLVSTEKYGSPPYNASEVFSSPEKKCASPRILSSKEGSSGCHFSSLSGASTASESTGIPSESEGSLVSSVHTPALASSTLLPMPPKKNLPAQQPAAYKPLPQSKQPGLLPSPGEIPKAIVLFTTMAMQTSPLRRKNRNRIV
ncbi:zinc finger, C3HC4 type (RING finger) domain-containing protein [Cardiosporidium cionae]|uniref:Zinc finger, C3HC4 type (RING finger) domain-containing protein n=1 Tax=Cardiosporidium cionae TaxID=476202 RepID=A0ABQ7JG70_9APIC|nr:zinc finger, C3HC4 type (RING finger) domain-containing protein [Cardiosporidium cionae]|eukprot:KAF8822655.1 zinc finger, C3HC4 type (RING finger) domain-containing protein [Cardiosporidium cionae]